MRNDDSGCYYDYYYDYYYYNYYYDNNTNNNLISVSNGGQSMRNNDSGLLLQLLQRIDRLLHDPLTGGVQGGGSLV